MLFSEKYSSSWLSDMIAVKFFIYFVLKRGCQNSLNSHIWMAFRNFNFHWILVCSLTWLCCVESFWYMPKNFLYFSRFMRICKQFFLWIDCDKNFRQCSCTFPLSVMLFKFNLIAIKLLQEEFWKLTWFRHIILCPA